MTNAGWRTLQLGSPSRIALIVSGVTGLCALPLLLPRKPKAIKLPAQRIALDADGDQVFQELASFDEGPRIVERNGNQIIAEIPDSVGWNRLTTPERIKLDADRRQVIFEQLRSPFFTVRTVTEVLEVSAQEGCGSLLTLHGVLWPRLGTLGWLITAAHRQATLGSRRRDISCARTPACVGSEGLRAEVSVICVRA